MPYNLLKIIKPFVCNKYWLCFFMVYHTQHKHSSVYITAKLCNIVHLPSWCLVNLASQLC